MGDWRYFPTWTHQCSHPTCSSYNVKLTVLHWETESLFLNQSGLYNNLQQLNAEGWCLETLLGRRKRYHFFWVLSVSLLSSAPSCHVVRKPRPHGDVPANSSMAKIPASHQTYEWICHQMILTSSLWIFQLGSQTCQGREKPPPVNSAIFCLNSWPSETVSSFTH